MWGPCASSHPGGAVHWAVPVGGVRPGAAVQARARCKYGVLPGGWDVGFGRGDGVLQLEHLLGHEAKHFLGLP